MPHPRKRFGQHFLSDQTIIQRIVLALLIEDDDHLIEIGPGQGALTMPVLKRVKRLEVIELDRDLIPVLQKRAQGLGQLEIHAADVLDFDFRALKKDSRPLKVFGNLPYNISTPLLFHLLSFANIIADMIFMLQKEVAHRLAAPVGSNDYGRLSVMMQYHCHVELLFDVPPEAFFPPPRVQSSIVRLVPHLDYPHRAQDEMCFAEIVRQAFGQRRKTIRNSLKALINDDVWAQLPFSSELRAENLSVSDFVMISNVLTASQASKQA